MATPFAGASLTVTISLILAMAENGVIGRGGTLPWHLPDDLRRFKKLTTGHTVVMGRKTFEAIGKPLPDRRNVVLTRNRAYCRYGVLVLHDLSEALRGAGEADEIFVAGGAEIYRQLIQKADRVYQTLVHAIVEGDTSFEGFDVSEWNLMEEEFHEADTSHAYPFSFRFYIRDEKRPVS